MIAGLGGGYGMLQGPDRFGWGWGVGRFLVVCWRADSPRWFHEGAMGLLASNDTEAEPWSGFGVPLGAASRFM